jgi:hypothetical protein
MEKPQAFYFDETYTLKELKLLRQAYETAFGFTEAMQQEYEARLKYLFELEKPKNYALAKACACALDLRDVFSSDEAEIKVEWGDRDCVVRGSGTYAIREKLKILGFWWLPTEKAWKFVRRPRHANRARGLA